MFIFVYLYCSSPIMRYKVLCLRFSPWKVHYLQMVIILKTYFLVCILFLFQLITLARISKTMLNEYQLLNILTLFTILVKTLPAFLQNGCCSIFSTPPQTNVVTFFLITLEPFYNFGTSPCSFSEVI